MLLSKLQISQWQEAHKLLWFSIVEQEGAREGKLPLFTNWT
jgi:hypothetical protein